MDSTVTNGRRILAQEATIRTATVELRTLTVSGKQVTLAVFRQLIEEDFVNTETYESLGPPWGHVNYHPVPASCPNDDHRHIVWQKDNELRRATVSRYRSDTGKADEVSSVCDSAARLNLYCNLSTETHPELSSRFFRPVSPFGAGNLKMTLRIGGTVLEFYSPRIARPLYGLPGDEDGLILRRLPENYDPEPDAQLLALVDKAWAERRRKWDEVWQTVMELDQLFIAV